MKKKLINDKYVFCHAKANGKKQFLHNTKKGIEIRNNIHSNILVINPSDDILKQLAATIRNNPSYKDFKKVSLLELTPKKLINESRCSWFGRIFKRLFTFKK